MIEVGRTMFLDPQHCIGCRACVAACRECESHRGKSMIFIDFLDRAYSFATALTLCMHCQDPPAPCAQVCPTQAILIGPAGVVQQALKERCIACENCIHACPFGVPKLSQPESLQYKCNLCYDRVEIDKRPMCATVCPSGALFFGTYQEFVARQRGRPVQIHRFGRQLVQTRVFVMAPAAVDVLPVEQLRDYGEALNGAVSDFTQGKEP